MPARIVAGILFVLLLAVDAAFAQAAAESVLLHGNAAAATGKAGTELGRTFDKTSNRIAEKIRAIPTPKVVVHPNLGLTQSAKASPSPGTTAAPVSDNSGSMIVSIQGGRVTRSAKSQSASSGTGSSPK